MSEATLVNRLWEKVPQREKIAVHWKKGNAMFGKPDWFRAKAVGWGLTPTRWQGWVYSGLWTAVIALPFVALVWRHQAPEAMCWLAATCAALVWDVRQIRKAMDAPAPAEVVAKKDVFYIGDDQADSTRLATKNYDLQVRR
jgi:hypothetical protein